MAGHEEWIRTRNELVDAVVQLGHPAEIGQYAAQELGSPKAIRRMISYLRNVQPTNVEILVDEVLAIKSEIEMWREKKASEEANAAINEIINNGFFGEEDDE